jgi:hypothetical protein
MRQEGAVNLSAANYKKIARQLIRFL